jgi:hypothetical protein
MINVGQDMSSEDMSRQPNATGRPSDLAKVTRVSHGKSLKPSSRSDFKFGVINNDRMEMVTCNRTQRGESVVDDFQLRNFNEGRCLVPLHQAVRPTSSASAWLVPLKHGILGVSGPILRQQLFQKVNRRPSSFYHYSTRKPFSRKSVSIGLKNRNMPTLAQD